MKSQLVVCAFLTVFVTGLVLAKDQPVWDGKIYDAEHPMPGYKPEPPAPPAPTDWKPARMNQLLTGSEDGTGTGGLAGMESKWDQLSGTMAKAQADAEELRKRISELDQQAKDNKGSWNQTSRDGVTKAEDAKAVADALASDDKDALKNALQAGSDHFANNAENQVGGDERNKLFDKLKEAHNNFDHAQKEANDLVGEIEVTKDVVRDLNKQMHNDPETGLTAKDRDIPDWNRTDLRPDDRPERPTDGVRPTDNCPPMHSRPGGC